MPYSQKYCLVHFISPIANGAEFSMANWPLHVTLADVFAIDLARTDVLHKLSKLWAKQKPVTVATTKEATLGTTDVILLDKTQNIIRLHKSIIELLLANDAVFNNPEFTLDGFLPHSTIQKTDRLQLGHEVTIDSLSLVDMLPDQDARGRKVITTFTI